MDSVSPTARQYAGGLGSRSLARHKVAVGVLTALVGVGYSAFSLTLNYTFQTSSYDLVIFDQAVRSYARFQPGISVIKGLHNGFGPHFSVLGDHWSPILASLAPLYWIYNSPETLLVAQAVLFALAVPPLWLFTRRAFGVTGADQILIARSKGVPAVALAVIYRRNPFVLFSLAKSGIKAPTDYVGKKVGVKIGGNEELIYRAVLAKSGIDKSKLTEIPVKFDITPLLTGTVDVWPGYLINEVLAAKEKGFEVNVVYPSDYGIDLYADTLFTTEKMLKEKPELVKKFVAATLKGWNAAIAAPEEAAKITVKYGDKLTYDHELAMMKASVPLLTARQQAGRLHGRSRLELRAKASARRRLPETAGRRRQGLHHASDADQLT